jgi:hypothetical protein
MTTPLQYAVLNGKVVGHFDGEYVYGGFPKTVGMIYRVDGEEVYDMVIPCNLVAFLEDNIARTPKNNKILFTIQDEFH